MKFYQTLNQQPRSQNHGKYRRTSPPAHRSSADRADHGAGGTVTWHTVNIAKSSSWVVAGFDSAAKPPALPYAGIRTGELIGYRLWWVIEEAGEPWLCSIAHERLWKPGEIVSGNLNEAVDWFGTVWGGVYAFDGANRLANDIELMRMEIRDLRHFRDTGHCAAFLLGWSGALQTATFAVGTIKMWGEVVEHQRGYRSEFAKLNSIDAMHGPGDIEAIRRRYGVALHQGCPP